MENGETSGESIEDRIIELAKNKPDGITNNEIKADIPDTPPDIWIKTVNKLLKNGYNYYSMYTLYSLQLHLL